MLEKLKCSRVVHIYFRLCGPHSPRQVLSCPGKAKAGGDSMRDRRTAPRPVKPIYKKNRCSAGAVVCCAWAGPRTLCILPLAVIWMDMLWGCPQQGGGQQRSVATVSRRRGTTCPSSDNENIPTLTVESSSLRPCRL